DANGRSTSFVGHRGAVAITGQLVLPMGADLAAWKKGAIGFMRGALAVAGRPEALAAAAQCRWFHEPSLRALLPGDAFSQQVFVENSCMAQNGTGAALVLAIREDRGGVDLRDPHCSWQPLSIGGAAIGTACSGGRPRIQLQVQ